MHVLPTYFPDLDPPFEVFYQQILDQIALAEELGWECFWFTEHHFNLYGGPEPNPAVFLSAAAARTSRIHLGSAVSVLPLHQPIQVAEDYAMVDVMSGGRLEFGIGLGNTPGDFAHFGVPREEARARFEEEAEIVARAWTEERFSYRGQFWDFEDVSLFPPPMQRPTPPIWVAGHSVDTLGWAGRHGFNIMTTAHPYPPEHYTVPLNAWRDGLQECGLSPADRHCKVHLRVWVDESTERAKEVAEAALIRYDDISAISRGQTFDPSTYDFEGMLA
ncbi:MAG TPA: LLM class flavin-dependent oxidoreductase, partial [Chloroflexota bacterium]